MVREKDGQRKRRRDNCKRDFDAVELREQEESGDDKSGSESESEEEEEQKPVIELSEEEKKALEKINREREEARKRDEALNKELMGEFGSGGRTAADKKNRMKKKMDEDASDSEDDEERKQREGKEREKLAEVRALREEQKTERLEKEQKEAARQEREEQEKKERDEKKESTKCDVGVALLKLLRDQDKFAAENEKRKTVAEISLNQLNQDAACKKLLKPLLKKHSVKQLNKAFLEKVLDGFKAAAGKTSGGAADKGRVELWEDEKKIVYVGLRKA